MNNHKCSIHCDEASNTRRSICIYLVASDGVPTDMARIYVSVRNTAVSGVTRQLFMMARICHT